MTVGYIGPENIRHVVELVLASENVPVAPLSPQGDKVAIIILAKPPRRERLIRIKSLYPQARLIAFVRCIRRCPRDLEVLRFTEIWKIRDFVRARLEHATK